MRTGFFLRGGVVWYRSPDGIEQRVGEGHAEIGRWWRTQLATASGLPSPDDPRYNAMVDRVFGGE